MPFDQTPEREAGQQIAQCLVRVRFDNEDSCSLARQHATFDLAFLLPLGECLKAWEYDVLCEWGEVFGREQRARLNVLTGNQETHIRTPLTKCGVHNGFAPSLVPVMSVTYVKVPILRVRLLLRFAKIRENVSDEHNGAAP